MPLASERIAITSLKGQGVHLSRPVLLHGLCPYDLSRELAGSRNGPPGTARQALSHGNQGIGFPQHPDQRHEFWDWRMYADFELSLIAEAHSVYSKESFLDDLNETVYDVDATTIDLCVHLFPWAHVRKTRGAIKPHTLLVSARQYTVFHPLSDGKLGEFSTLDVIPVEVGAFCIMDRGYLDYARLYCPSQEAAFFITRAKSNLKC